MSNQDFNFQTRRAWVKIDHQALAHNVRTLKGILAPETKLMTVIKADAYGHGAITVAKTVLESGADYLAIATLSEGIELRQGGINHPMMILGAINTPDEIKEIIQWKLEPTICNPEQGAIFCENSL